MADLTGLPDFLLARWEEDETGARAAKPGPWRWDTSGGAFEEEPAPAGAPDWGDAGPNLVTDAPLGDQVVICATGHDASSVIVARADAEHITRWDPDRVLAEVQRGRFLVGLYQERQRAALADDDPHAWTAAAVLLMALQLEALPHAGHADCHADWLPTL